MGSRRQYKSFVFELTSTLKVKMFVQAEVLVNSKVRNVHPYLSSKCC